MTLLALLLVTAAFALFGLVADAHCKRFFATLPSVGVRRKMRAAGWAAAALAFPSSVTAQGWVFGPILWTALLMLGAAVVFLSLNLIGMK
jgi:hypothetical protein